MIPKMKFKMQTAAFTQEYLEGLLEVSNKFGLLAVDIPPLRKLNKHLRKIKAPSRGKGKKRVVMAIERRISRDVDDLSKYLEGNKNDVKLEELESSMKNVCNVIRQKKTVRRIGSEKTTAIQTTKPPRPHVCFLNDI